ncbi:MAG: discoidin domain-containing protein [Tannerellaceae bacterium]|nr:discoidin domain-containing protein [Tannerellaceae bacterium]
MKKIFFTGLIFLTLIGCKEQDFPYIGSIVFEEYEILFEKEAGTHSLPVKCDIEGVTATIKDAEAIDWCKINFTGDALEVILTENPESMRFATVHLKGGYYETQVELIQQGALANYFKLDNKGWEATCSDEEKDDGGGVMSIFDEDDQTTYWHSAYSTPSELPHWILIDILEEKVINKVALGWRQHDKNYYAQTKTTEIHVSTDGENFTKVTEIDRGTPNPLASPDNAPFHEAAFDNQTARYIKLLITESNDRTVANMAFVKVYTPEYIK